MAGPGGTTDQDRAAEDTDAGLRVRMRSLERQNDRIEAKVDRLQWSIVAGAIGYLISVWTGLGNPGP